MEISAETGSAPPLGAPVQAVDRDDQLLVPRGLPGNGGFRSAVVRGVRLGVQRRRGVFYHRRPSLGRTVMDLGYRGLRAAAAMTLRW